MNPEIAIAQLSIVDGAWQESPDNVARFDEGDLPGGAPGRGRLSIVAEVTGDQIGREAVARELIETARREYGASRGSIMLGLAQAVRSANDALYNLNANAPREARRIAGMTAAILRDDEVFIAQAGPGLACLARGTSLTRFPEESPWFDPDEEAVDEMIASRNFPSEGAVPMGMRASYNPDQFHISLQPGDVLVLATRTLAHLFSNEELLDTLADHHPDEIISNLEDMAGTLDLSVIAMRVTPAASPAGTMAFRPASVSPPAAVIPSGAASTSLKGGLEAGPSVRHEEQLDQGIVEEDEEFQAPAVPEPPVLPTARRAERHARPGVQIDSTRARSAAMRLTAGAMAALAGLFSLVNWKAVSTTIDRAVSTISRAVARAVLILLRNVLPGEPKEDQPARAAPPALEAGWRILALLFPLVMIGAGSWMWMTTRADQQRLQAAQVADLISQAKASIDRGKNLEGTDRAAAHDAFTQAITLTNQATALAPNNPAIRTVYYSAQDELDSLSGVSVLLFLPSFATYSDPAANPSRIVTHYPDVYVLDRGTSRVYHYVVNNAGPSVTPTPGDGTILKAGDKAGDWTVSTLVDLLWVDPGGRLIAVDKTGAFLEYDPGHSTWSAHAARDNSQWKNVELAATYSGNLYLVDQDRDQILKYVPAEGAWTSSVTYFAPGVSFDLTNVTDIAIDGDLWLSRSDGSIARFTQGKPNNLTLLSLDTPMTNTVAIVTSQDMSGIYLADAGNQRIVQIDKTSGKFLHQYKPSGQYRDTFKSLKALAVDEPDKKFFFVNGNQAYLATIPQ